MNTAAEFDPSQYTTAPVITLKSGITLCKALAANCPSSGGAAIKKSAKKLLAVADEAQRALDERQRLLGLVSESESAAIDHEADAVWGALRARLQAYGELPDARFPKAPRARKIVDTLFGPEGLLPLKDKYPAQRTAMQSWLNRIENEGFAKDLEALAGKEFLEAAREVQPLYDAMVDSLLSRGNKELPNALVHTRAMQKAIVNLATKLCGTVDDEDPASIEAVQTALLPIVRHREAQTQATTTTTTTTTTVDPQAGASSSDPSASKPG